MSLQLRSTLARALVNIVDFSLLFEMAKIEASLASLAVTRAKLLRNTTGMRSLLVPSATPISVLLFFLFGVGPELGFNCGSPCSQISPVTYDN